MPTAPDADAGRVRRGQRRRRSDVHRRGAGSRRGPARAAVRRPRGQAAGQVAGRDRARASRRVHRQHAQVPPAQQPRPLSERDRDLQRLSAPAGGADPAEGDLHAGELLDQAAASRLDRDLTAAWARRGPHDRDQGGSAAAALPPRGGVVHAVQSADAARRFRPHSRPAGPRSAATARARARAASSSRARARRDRTGNRAATRARARPDPEPELDQPDPGDAQLGLF